MEVKTEILFPLILPKIIYFGFCPCCAELFAGRLRGIPACLFRTSTIGD